MPKKNIKRFVIEYEDNSSIDKIIKIKLAYYLMKAMARDGGGLRGAKALVESGEPLTMTRSDVLRLCDFIGKGESMEALNREA